MSVRLLDVNVLIGLLDSAHVHHGSVTRWFHANAHEGWASCPLTENGFVRVVSSISYPNLRLTPSMASESLRRFKENFSGTYRFWPDSVSLDDSDLFDLSVLTGSRQTTDTYLAGLAFNNEGILATLEGGIVWRAVKGGGAGLIERIIR